MNENPVEPVMQKIQVSLSLPKETYEVGQALEKIVDSINLARKDGWNMGQDLPVIVTAALGQLVAAIEGFQNIPEEFAHDKVAFFQAALLPISSALGKIIEGPK